MYDITSTPAASTTTTASTSGKLDAKDDMATATKDATLGAIAADGRPAPTTPSTPSTPTTIADPTTTPTTPTTLSVPLDQTSTARAHSMTRTARETAPRSRTRGALDSVSPHGRTCSTPATSPNRSERTARDPESPETPSQMNTARSSKSIPVMKPTVRSSASMTITATVPTRTRTRPLQPRSLSDDEDSWGLKDDDAGKATEEEIEATLAEDARIAKEAAEKEEAEKNKKEKAAEDTKNAKAAEEKKKEKEEEQKRAKAAEDKKREAEAEEKKQEADKRSMDTRASARTISRPSGARLEHCRSLYKLCGSIEARTEFVDCVSASLRPFAAGISVDEACAVSDALQRGTVLVIKKRREEKPEEKGRDLRRVKRVIDVVAVTESAYPDEVYYVQLARSEIAITIYRTGFLRVADNDFRAVAWPSYKTFTAPPQSPWIALCSLPPVVVEREDLQSVLIGCLDPADWKIEDEVNVALKFNSATEAGWMKAMLEGMTLYGVKIIVENR